MRKLPEWNAKRSFLTATVPVSQVRTGTNADMIDIDITNRQTAMPVDEPLLDRAARLILGDYGPRAVEVNVAVVDNPTIHELNRRFLEHDYPTDVLSFVLEDQPERLEGDVIISADMAAAEAGAHDMSPENE